MLTVNVIGLGRAGGAIAARLHERGVFVERDAADLIVLAVPDKAIADVARTIAPGPWVAHVSGATPLSALAPHERRFSVHPLQTLVRSRGPEQLDGAWAAVTAATDEARAHGWWLAEILGLRPFELEDSLRALYHAGATIASSYLVTIYRMASRACEQAGAPQGALVPLMQRTIENHFEMTGPFARGDWATVEAHVKALGESLPDVVPVYEALAEVTRP